MKKFGKDLQPNTAEHPAGTAPQTAQQLSVQLRLAKTTVKLAAALLVLIPAVVVYLSSAWFARNTEVTGGGASVSVVKPGASLYTRKLMALRAVNSEETAALPSRTCSVLTTDSLAMKPEIRDVAHRQSPKPSGAKSTASH